MNQVILCVLFWMPSTDFGEIRFQFQDYESESKILNNDGRRMDDCIKRVGSCLLSTIAEGQ